MTSRGVRFAPDSADARIRNRFLKVASFGMALGRSPSISGRLLEDFLCIRPTTHPGSLNPSIRMLRCSDEEGRTTLVSYVESANIVNGSLGFNSRPAEARWRSSCWICAHGISEQIATHAFLATLLDRSVSLYPGSVFGVHYGSFAPLLFYDDFATQVKEGIARINEVLTTWRTKV